MKTIGMIGIGLMGASMGRNLMKNGYTVQIYARDRAKAEALRSEGALWRESIPECVHDCDAVITIVGYPADVEQIYFGEDGILIHARPGAYLIDMTTSSPSLAQTLYTEGGQRGLHVLDAPVTGGTGGARDGTLSILVGGDKADFDACLPLFRAMGTNITYQGGAGSGQHAKMANQIMIAANLSGVCEALSYAKAKGLDPDTLITALSTGAAGSYQFSNFAPKIARGDYQATFYLKHFVKDMAIAAKEAEESELTLPVLGQVLSHYRALEAEGYGNCGTQTLYRHYEKQN